MLKVINLWGGPGLGKSTNAAELFALMKKQGYRVELVTEYAKDVVYSKEFFKLEDQLYIFTKQHHKLWKLRGQVDYAIVDSPLPLSILYAPDTMIYDKTLFFGLVMSTFNRYDNQNFLLERDLEIHPYQQYGRTQTLNEAIHIDKSISMLLDSYGITHTTVKVDDVAQIILKSLQ